MKLKDLFYGVKLGLSVKKKFKLKFKTMDQLFQLWKLINSPSTSAAWKLNKSDFIKTVVRTVYMAVAPLTVTQLSTGTGTLDWQTIGITALGAFVIGIGHAAVTGAPAK